MKPRFAKTGRAAAMALLGLTVAGWAADDKKTVQGGTVTGGSVTGGSVTGGSVTGGTVTGGTVTPGTVTAGTVTATAGDREIRVVSLGKVSVNVSGGTATVHLDDHVFDIEKDKMVLDGALQGALPADSKKVLVEVKDEMMTVTADGKEVLQAKLGKIEKR